MKNWISTSATIAKTLRAVCCGNRISIQGECQRRNFAIFAVRFMPRTYIVKMVSYNEEHVIFNDS